MDRDLVKTARIVGEWKVPGSDNWREEYRSAVEIQCAQQLMLKCAACGRIHIANAYQEAVGKTECSSCRASYKQFAEASIDEVLQTVGADWQAIAVPSQFVALEAARRKQHDDAVMHAILRGTLDGIKRFETDPEFRAEIKKRTA